MMFGGVTICDFQWGILTLFRRKPEIGFRMLLWLFYYLYVLNIPYPLTTQLTFITVVVADIA